MLPTERRWPFSKTSPVKTACNRPRTVHAAEPAELACVETGLTTLDWESALEASPQVVARPARRPPPDPVPEHPCPGHRPLPRRPCRKPTANPTLDQFIPRTRQRTETGSPHRSPTTMPTAPDWLPAELWERWRRTGARSRNRSPPMAPALLFAQLAKAKSFGHDPVELLETAIVNGWQSCVFPISTTSRRPDPTGTAVCAMAPGGLADPSTDPAAYRQTAGFATELEAA